MNQLTEARTLPSRENLGQKRMDLTKLGILAETVNFNEMNYRTARKEAIISGAIGKAMSSFDR